mmetsp:Transcript_203/g.308  ORF Transcript_203/g.308 Transcript_203/m.308 type:complete len:226 (+) Transcript_203:89-766(+)
MKTIALLISVVGLAATNAVELTPETWNTATQGKIVFVKFFAPWCGHCQAIKPDWDKLMAEYDGNPTKLIADVDCTQDGSDELCETLGIEGFPTLKYGDVTMGLMEYEGPRDYASLKTFADENLKPRCSPWKLDLCDDAERSEIRGYQAQIASGALAAAIAEKETAMDAAERAFDAAVEELQAQFEQLEDEKKAEQDAITNSGLSLMKAVLAQSQEAAAGGAADEL